jgi:hypothetical protein
MSSLIPPVSEDRRQWYSTEKNTAALIQTVLKYRWADGLSGHQIWRLITLTWITKGKKHVSSTHWKRLKVPALETLFKENATVSSGLSETIDSMGLPDAVACAAKKETGMVNFRGPCRKSSRKWCNENRGQLRNIIQVASKLPANDQARITLARCIDRLQPVESPNRKAEVGAGVLLTPLIACIDPRNRFPIVNGNGAVNSLLRKLRLNHRNLPDRVKGLIGIIAQKDAFMLDVMSEEVIKRVRVPQPPNLNVREGKISESPLRDYDEAERQAVFASKTLRYRQRHNAMTAALRRIFGRHDPITETTPAGRCDTILKNYDGSRDLLIEAKPDPDKGPIRIAIGQLFDYGRHRPRQAATDLAVVTITRPTQDYVDLLVELGITVFWFEKTCRRIGGGEGKAWSSIAECICRTSLAIDIQHSAVRSQLPH